MQLTKFTHACVRLDDGDRHLVIDPGAFSEVEAALDGVAAVLITHEHVDHIDVGRLSAALRADPRLSLFAPAGVAASLAEFGEQVTAVAPGETFHAADMVIEVFGGQHALIHPSIPVVANNSYLIEAGVFHPGDSFTVPPRPVDTLLVPTNAPWSKGSEVIDFTIAVRAPKAVQIHDGLITSNYANLIEGHIARLAGPFGVDFQHLSPVETITI